MPPNKVGQKNRPPKNIREELLDWLQKGEHLARKSLKGQPEALREILSTMRRIRKVVKKLLANPKTLGRLTYEITSRVKEYGQEVKADPANEAQSRTWLLGMAEAIRSEVRSIEEDKGLHFD